MEQERVEILHEAVGGYLALGMTNGEVLLQLQVDHELEVEEAQVILRGVYDSWVSVNEVLDLQAEDTRNWHQYLRMQLLQDALKESNTPGRRLALLILDSLASIQGIATEVGQTVPLPIVLIAKEPEVEPAEGKEEDGTDTG